MAIDFAHIVSSRGALNGSGLSAESGSATYRVRLVCPERATGLRPAYGNWYWDIATEIDGPSTLTIKAAIEYPYGASAGSPGPIYPVYFRGRRTATLEPGGDLVADPLGLTIPAGAAFGVRTYVTATGGTEQWPVNLAATGSDNQGYVAGSDLADSGTITTALRFCLAPTAVFGTRLNPAVGSLGYSADSIGYGQGDTGASYGEGGFIMRALGSGAPSRPFLRAALSGYAAHTAVAAGGLARRARYFDGVECWLDQWGINDISAQPLATVQADKVAFWEQLFARGIRVWATTLGPSTADPSFTWSTLGGQAVTAYESKRVGYNNWLRSGWAALGLAGYFEVADTVESARDSGKWAVAGGTNALGQAVGSALTADGLHPVTAGYILMAPAITVASFTPSPAAQLAGGGPRTLVLGGVGGLAIG